MRAGVVETVPVFTVPVPLGVVALHLARRGSALPVGVPRSAAPAAGRALGPR